MTRFAIPTAGSTKTRNFEGEPAYTLNPKLELYGMVCTSTFNSKFYEGKDEFLIRLRKLIPQVPVEFILKLAIYAREKMYLRTIPLVLLVETLMTGARHPQYSHTITRCIQRADELYEILGYYMQANKRDRLHKLSHSIKDGVGLAFNKFDEYQFGKYNRDVNPSLRDALFITHPKPKNLDQQAIFDKITTQTLDIPYTWETELSEKGNTQEVWESLIDSGKLPYMALLRNLRNILNAGVCGKPLSTVADMIADQERVKRSRQLPFRFYSAYKEVGKLSNFSAQYIQEAIDAAFTHSTANLPFNKDERVVIACDVSGSMNHQISPRSQVTLMDIGIVLGIAAARLNPQNILGGFGDEFKIYNGSKTLDMVDRIREDIDTGWSTNGWKVYENLIQNNTVADRVYFFTDGQFWNSYSWNLSLAPRRNPGGDISTTMETLKQYRNVAPDVKSYFFNMAGYSTLPVSVNGKNVYTIAGWSDKVFNVLENLDEGQLALSAVEEIEI